MEIKVLGQVELSNGSKSLLLRRSKAGQVLSLLVARSNETVSVDTLIDELWGEQVPRSALTTLQTYVYHLRKMLTHDLRVPEAERLLVTRPPGYAIVVDQSAVDVSAFGRLVKEGTRHLVDGDNDLAAGRLSEALNLWRGPAFAGMRSGRVLEAHATYLEETRVAAIGLRIEAHQRLGRYWELIPELRSLIAKNPLNEGFHAQLIGALCRCGRRAEALQAYQRLWHVLDSELGVEPAPAVQRLHHEVLAHGESARSTFQYSYPTA